jgi:hypothetical protein
MRVSLIDIDSTIPNLALKKCEKYHLDRGDTVSWNNPLEASCSDKTYVSCIFEANKDKCKEFEGWAEIGGSGYSLTKTLPPEIEAVKPRINLGFTTRGCIRNCSFCIVPKKEGSVRIEGDLYDIWDGHSKDVVFMDNNATAISDHFLKVLRQAQKEKVRVDYNQGLDHRLLTDEFAIEMKKTRHVEYRFSFDHPSYEKTVRQAIEIINRNKLGRCFWYVLVGFNTTWEQDWSRLMILRELNQNAFVQRYKTVTTDKKYIALAGWVNQHHLFRTMPFETYLEKKNNGSYKKYFL